MNKFAKHIAILVGAALTVASTACEDDFGRDMGGNGNNRDTISFSISSDNAASRADNSEETEIIEIKQRYTSIVVAGDTIPVCVTIMPNNPVVFSDIQETPDSRSAAVTTDNLTSFNVTALDEDGDLYFNKDFNSSDKGTDGSYSTEHYWPSIHSLGFFTTASNLGISPKTKYGMTFLREGNTGDLFTKVRPLYHYIRFNYNMPDVEDAGKTNATDQPDIVLGIAENRYRKDNPEQIVLHHALSAVDFKVGTFKQDIRVTGVDLIGVKNSGSCEMKVETIQGSDFTEENQHSSAVTTWTWTPGSNKSTYTASFDKTVTEGATGDAAVINTTSDNTTFMLIPQPTTDMKLKFKFGVSGNGFVDTERSYEFEASLAALLGSEPLKADHKYIITVGLNQEEMGISVNDDCDATVKNNVAIQNTGFATGYVRAAIVGFWKNGSGDIIVPWNDDKISPNEEYGKFEWNTPAAGGDWTAHWKLASDNYYYHQEPVARNQETYPLFNTYTLNAAAPVTGAVLEIDIVAQIIHENSIKTWTAFPWP
ncbi:MAG: hypothetical protein ACI30S_09700 [Muribaculaceae bacterium]